MKKYQKISDELENKRNEFYDKLKKDIYNFSSTHLWPGSCDDTVRYALEKNGFSVLGIPYRNIEKNIEELKLLSEETEDIKIIKGSPGCNLHMSAQMAANASIGDYIVIALLANYRYPEKKLGGCHHMGIVIKKNKITEDPLIGQGGLSPKYINKIFAPASWSFSWNWKNTENMKNKYCMVYFKYGLKNEKNT